MGTLVPSRLQELPLVSYHRQLCSVLACCDGRHVPVLALIQESYTGRATSYMRSPVHPACCMTPKCKRSSSHIRTRVLRRYSLIRRPLLCSKDALFASAKESTFYLVLQQSNHLASASGCPELSLCFWDRNTGGSAHRPFTTIVSGSGRVCAEPRGVLTGGGLLSELAHRDRQRSGYVPSRPLVKSRYINQS